jgi:site-specific DNA-methyltransferase (adenine-specific)
LLPDLAYSFETKIIMAWKLFEGDCLEIMPLEIEDKSIDLIVLDPPYNIKKAKWDKFKSHEDYLEFIFKVIKECERVLKDNGSLYIWHNDFQVLSDIQYLFRTQSDFQFKQLIVWNKRFNGAHNKGFLDGFIETNHLRNYQKMSEYLLFYTFQDESGLSKIFSNKDCFKSIKDYMRMEKRKLKENKGFKTDNEFNDFIKDYCGCASVIQRHYFADSQWCFPVEHLYKRLQSTGFFKREYEDLRREYEDLRYTFNNQKTHHSVWDYQIEKKIGHITPKPIKLCENIIKHSSNHNDKVLIPFAGSGSEMIAGHKHNRNVIGIEKEPNYCDIIRNRLSEINLEQYQPERVHKPLTSF